MAYCNRDCNMMMMMMKWPYHRNIIIVNFVKNEKCGRVDVFLHVYKSPYSNCCQMGFFLPEYIKVDVGYGFALDPTGGAYSALLDSPAG